MKRTLIFFRVHLLRSLLQNVTTRSARIWDVMKNIVDLAITPQHSTIPNVVKYARIFSMRTVNSRHAWLAIDPLSLRGGKSRKTSHALVSAKVLWLKYKFIVVECVYFIFFFYTVTMSYWLTKMRKMISILACFQR